MLQAAMARPRCATPLLLALLCAQAALGAPPAAPPAAPSAAPPAAPGALHARPKGPPPPKAARHPNDVSLPEHLAEKDLEPRPPPPPAITDVKNPRCTGYFCSIELCLPIEECDGVVLPNATECGCCPLCVKYLDEGRTCGRRGVLRFPERPTTMCRPPLRCWDFRCSSLEADPLRRGAKPAGAHPALAPGDHNAIDE